VGWYKNERSNTDRANAWKASTKRQRRQSGTKKGQYGLVFHNAPQTTLCLCLFDHAPYFNNRFSQILDLDLMESRLFIFLHRTSPEKLRCLKGKPPMNRHLI